MLENVTRFETNSFLHCGDRADSGIEHVRTYCVAGGAHNNSKTSYTPTAFMKDGNLDMVEI